MLINVKMQSIFGILPFYKQSNITFKSLKSVDMVVNRLDASRNAVLLDGYKIVCLQPDTLTQYHRFTIAKCQKRDPQFFLSPLLAILEKNGSFRFKKKRTRVSLIWSLYHRTILNRLNHLKSKMAQRACLKT